MKNKKKVFLVGVGGAGMSALAKYFFEKGYLIYGSDKNKNENIEKLISDYGLNFFENHSEDNLNEDFDFLIYSPAIEKNNPERKKAEKIELKEYSYPEFLGHISSSLFTVAISGTNGKTTTTTMAMEVFDFFNKNFLAIVGAESKKFKTNFLNFGDEFFLVEACEYKKSFLNLKPNIIVITNITPDHLDYFGNFNNYKKVFIDFLKKGKEKKENILICPKGDKNFKEVVNFAEENNYLVIDYEKYQIEKVRLPGEHNIKNAKAVLALVDYFNLDLNEAKKYLINDFQGPLGRFEKKGISKNGMEIYDDYAHNPEGLEYLLKILKNEYKDKKNILVFQPHLYSRTKDFFNDFVKIISEFDEIYLLPIYGARENKKEYNIDSLDLIKEIKKNNKNIYFCQNIDDCYLKIKEKKYDNDHILLTAGAGEAFKLSKKILN